VAFDKDQLVAMTTEIRRLYDRLPYWDNTAKLNGKIIRLQTLAESWDERSDPRGLLDEIRTLEGAVKRLHDRDPLTHLLRRLTEWRTSLEESEAS
jgi:hypothetical protein